ncbi:MAG: hypothetical protein A2Y17_13555 [Clostridiales bacterium GWF2_38_85]|nr:MAG: hypothetical protein A2Y17_13555 [Clostridiales bacterium GWF2_38_85]
MKNYQDSDYAANKYASGIVYRFTTQTIEVTLEDYLRENSGKSEADFAELKAQSDKLFHEQDRSEGRQRKKMVSIHNIEETELVALPSPEDVNQEEAEKQTRCQIVNRALAALTEIQRRRYLQYHVNGLTLRQIAEVEGVVHSKIQKSLLAAEKKIKKILADG